MATSTKDLLATVTEMRQKLQAGTTEREAAKAARNDAVALVQAATVYTNAVEAMAETLLEADKPVPELIRPETVEFCKGVISAWQSAPSEELQTLRDELASLVNVAKHIGLPDEEKAESEATIKAFDATRVASDKPVASGKKGDGKWVIARHLGPIVPHIEYTRPSGEVLTHNPGERDNDGDWGTGRQWIKDRYNEDEAARGVARDADYTAFKRQLDAVIDGLVGMYRDESIPSFSHEATDAHGTKVTVSAVR